MPVTLKDIAREAGVTRQAVAAALSLSGTGKVSPELKERVQKIARDMRYTPNQTARRLKGAASRTIGIYGVPYASVLNQSFFNELSVQLDRYGYNLMTCYGMNDAAAERAMRDLIAKGIDGVIVTTQENPLSRISGVNIPSVFCPPARIDGFDLAVDHAAGMAVATRELLTRGRRRLVFLPPCVVPMVTDRPNQEKFRGIRIAAAEAGLTPELLTVAENEGDGARILSRLRELNADAVLCSNDYFAGRLIQLLLASGIRVPDDVMVVGYDGLSLCDLCAVPLATVVQPLQRLAQAAVEILLERIDGKMTSDAPRGILLEPYFYASASCGEFNPRLTRLPFFNSFSSLEAIWENRF